MTRFSNQRPSRRDPQSYAEYQEDLAVRVFALVVYAGAAVFLAALLYRLAKAKGWL